jgi:predicted glycosyltransferase involved in capsule biosynthesis
MSDCDIHPLILPDHDYASRTFAPAIAANILISRAIRIGFRVVIKTDIDCIISHATLADMAAITDGNAICPIPRFIDALGNTEDRPGPCGTIAMTAADWARLHGYDERMSGHGREDGDLYDRAAAMGIRITRPVGVLCHQHHECRQSATWYPRLRRENIQIPRELGLWQDVSAPWDTEGTPSGT